jgi:hypothetical protein
MGVFFGSKFPGFRARCWRIPVPRPARYRPGETAAFADGKGRLSRGRTRFSRENLRPNRRKEAPSLHYSFREISDFKALARISLLPSARPRLFPGSVSSGCGPDRRRGGETRGGDVGTAISDALPLKTGPSAPEIVPEEIRRTEAQSRSGASIDDLRRRQADRRGSR